MANPAIADASPVHAPALQRCILPTAVLVENLYSDLAGMSIADWELSEIIVNAISSVTIVHEIQPRLNQFVAVYTRHGGVTRPNDGMILARGFANFVRGILDNYKNYGLWDQFGQSHWFFERLHHNDIILCRYPL